MLRRATYRLFHCFFVHAPTSFSYLFIRVFLKKDKSKCFFSFIKGVSSSVAHKKGGFLGFFLNMKRVRETNDLLRIFEHIFIQQ